MAKTAIIITPKSAEVLSTIMGKLAQVTTPEEHEIIAIIDDNIPAESSGDNIKVLGVPAELNFAKRFNIARFLVSEDTEYLILLGSDVEPTSAWLKDRIYPFEADKKIIGISGVQGEALEPDVDEDLEIKMQKISPITKEQLAERCRRKDGTLNYVDGRSLATTVALWDTLGGLPVNSDQPGVEYCLRAQIIGYLIANQEA